MRRKWKLKKIVSLVLVLSIILSMNMTVFAVDSGDGETNIETTVDTKQTEQTIESSTEQVSEPAETETVTEANAENVETEAITAATNAEETGENKISDKTEPDEPAAQSQNDVAKIGETGYDTLAKAVEAAENGVQTRIVLLTDIEESITIAQGKNIILDLDGHKLTNTSNQHTVTNQGTLEITSSSSGTIDNVSNGRAAVFNQAGGVVTLSGSVTCTRSQEAGTIDGGANGNSFYTLQNQGRMIITGSVCVNQYNTTTGNTGGNSSLIANGWYNGNQKPSGASNSVLVIEYGTFSGGLNTVKNDDYGELEIYGGSFSNTAQATIMNWNIASISGGTFNSDHEVVVNGYLDSTMDQGVLEISDGTFCAGSGNPVISYNDENYGIGTITIKGGTFNAGEGAAQIIEASPTTINSIIAVSGGNFNRAIPKAQCADGFVPVDNGSGNYGVQADTNTYVAAIGDKKYENLAEAIKEAVDGETVTLLMDIADTGNISINKSITVDGAGKVVSGNSCFYAGAAYDITIKNINFSKIHNDAGKLSAIYGSRLSNKLSIVDCTFNNVDWDAIQITPVEGAVINIIGNTFSDDTEDGIQQQRYIHIQPSDETNFTATVTDNIMLGKELANAYMGIYFFSADSNVKFDGNYYENTANLSITSGSWANSVNANELAFPARMQKDVDVDDYVVVATIITDSYNSTLYTSLQDAMDAAEDGQTVTLLEDITVNQGENTLSTSNAVRYSGGKNITVDFNGYMVTANTENAAFVIVGGTDADSTVTLKNGTITAGDTAYCTVISNMANSGYGATVNVENMTLNNSKQWGNSVKAFAGSTINLTDTEVNSSNGAGGTEAAGGIVNIINCTYNQGGYYDHNSTNIAVSNGGTVNVYSGSYTSASYGAYVFNSGGTINIYDGTFESGKAVLKADTSSGAAAPSIINIEDGNFTGEYSIANGATLTVSGGLFSKELQPEYCADGYEPVITPDENGMYTVQKARVARIGEGDNAQLFDSLDAAIEAAKGGQTITLLTDITLEDNAPVKIIQKGSEGTPIILDMNGHIISGRNTKTGAVATTSTPGGILWISESHVILTDNSDGGKGGIVNTATSGSVYAVIVNSTTMNASDVHIQNGVRIEVENAGTSAAAIYAYATASCQNAEVTIDNVNVKSSGLVLKGSNATAPIVVNGGTFKSGLGIGVAGIYLVNNMTINGGTFTNSRFGYTQMQSLGENKVVVYTQDGEGIVTATVGEIPHEYVAHVTNEAFPDYNKAYLGTSNLYLLKQLDLFANGSIIEIKGAATSTFPEGTFYGNASGTAANITFDLVEDASLSGNMPLGIADVTITGQGTVEQNFFTSSDEEIYEMISSGENGLYSCRIKTDKIAAKVTYEGKEDIYIYANADDAFKLAKSINSTGMTIELCADYEYGNAWGINRNVTLNLNGFKYTYTDPSTINTRAFDVGSTGTLTVENGQIVVPGTAVASISINSGKVVIEKTATITGSTILLNRKNSILEVFGTIDTTGTANTPIQGNGDGTKGNTTITINEGAVIKADDTAAAAIYHPQSGVLNINGGTISGATGIYMKSGTLNVAGGSISGHGIKTDYVYENGAYTPTGDAIVLEACGYPGGAPIVTGFTDATVTSVNASPVECYYYAGTGETANADMADKAFITGGLFSSPVKEEYCADGYSPCNAEVENMYTVGRTFIGKSSDPTENIPATIVTADGTEVIYARVSAANIVNYSITDYPTTARKLGDGSSYIFAGWYQDAEGTEACTDISVDEYVYAKFVDANILTVKGQLSAGTTSESESTNLRFVTTVDTLDYQKVGFTITINGKTVNKESGTVYKTIEAGENGVAFGYEPTIFSQYSNYFMTFTITNIKNTAFDTPITVKPYWVTLDGTTVYGTERTLKVSDGLQGTVHPMGIQNSTESM